MKDENVILYDGYCPTCNFSVNLASKFSDKYYYSPLQSDFSQDFIQNNNLENIDSIILKKGGNYLLKSDAVFEILQNSKPPIRYLHYFKFIPKSIRDFLYDFIARNRYKLTGKYDTCKIPEGIMGRII